MNAPEEHPPELTSPEAVRYRGQTLYAQHDFEPLNEDEIQLSIGDEVEVVCTPPGGWIQVKNHAIKDAIGWVPQSHLTPLNMTGSRKNSSRRASAPGRALSSLINRASTRRGKGSTPLAVVSLATAQHEYTPSNQDELELQQGGLIYVMERPEGGWWRGYRELGPSKRVSGWFPATHVAINATQQVPMLQNQAIYETPTEGVHRPTRTPSPTTPTPVLRQRKASVTALMQDKRSTLNAEIEKELRVRAGAENMLTAYRNMNKRQRKKLAEKRRDIAVTLSFANSNLQQLRTELQNLNSKVQASVRQSICLAQLAQTPEASMLEALAPVTTMTLLALGLKETKPCIIAETVGHRLKQHFHENLDGFKPALERLAHLRQVVELHQRDEDSLSQHFEYFRRLQHVDERFALRGVVSKRLSFDWFDCFNGQPHDSTTIAFEQACVLFNAGALCMQMAAGCNTTSHKELDKARGKFEAAAGIFQYIMDHLAVPECADLSPLTLQMLVWLNLAQAQECMLLAYLVRQSKRDNSDRLPPGEAATIAEFNRKTVQLMSSNLLKGYLPPQWLYLTKIKALYYEGMSDYFTAKEQLTEVVPGTRNQDTASWSGLARYLRAEDHYKEALRLQADRLPHEQGLRSQLQTRLKQVEQALAQQERDTVFRRVGSTAELRAMLSPKSKPAVVCQPSYEQLAVDNMTADPFGPLGPVSIFNVASQFEAHRSVTFRLQLSQMDWRVEAHEQAAPVIIKSVSPSGLAHGHGFRSGDIILAINSKSARWKTLSDVEAMLLASDGKTVTLRVQHAPIVRLEQLALSSDMSDLTSSTASSQNMSRQSSNVSLQVVLHTGNAAEGGFQRPPMVRSFSSATSDTSSRPRLLSATPGASRLIAGSHSPGDHGKLARMASSPMLGAGGSDIFRNPLYEDDAMH